MKEDSEPDVAEKKVPEPLPVDPEERLNWDFDLGERPPPLETRRFMVRFRHEPAQPLPFPDPEDE